MRTKNIVPHFIRWCKEMRVIFCWLFLQLWYYAIVEYSTQEQTREFIYNARMQ